jgi:hypothetical protein
MPACCVPRFAKKTRAKWRSEARSDPEAVEFLQNLGDRIRTLRAKKQLSQEKAAEEAKLSRTRSICRTSSTVARIRR